MKKILFSMMLTIMGLSINAQWTAVNNGLDLIYSVHSITAFAVNGTSIFAGTDTAGIYLSTNNGSTWVAVNSGLTNHHVHALAVSGTNIFAGTEGGVFLSSNNGGSWAAVNNGLTSLGVKALAISGTNIYAAGTGVCLSTNNGSVWTAVNNGLTDVDPGGQAYTLGISTLAIIGTNIFAGTYADPYSNNGIFLSSNNGSNWTSTSTGMSWSLATSSTNVFSVAVGNNRVYTTSDNGNIWTYTTAGTPITELYALAISGTKIFAGGSSGVYLSTDNGNTWSAVNTGLPVNPRVYKFAICGTNIYAGTESSGIWKRPLSELVGIEENNSNVNFSIYPNPTNGFFTIQIDNGKSIKGEIEIYNVLGEKIYSMTNKQLANNIAIDLSDQPNGIYFLQIKTEQGTVNKKIIISR